jgi:hypothetical protein
VRGSCSDADYANFTAGSIALFNRNFLTDCTLIQKISLAQQKGAIGAIGIYDPGSQGLFSSGLQNLAPFPGFSVTFELGMEILEVLNLTPVRMNMFANTAAPLVYSANVLGFFFLKKKDNNIILHPKLFFLF